MLIFFKCSSSVQRLFHVKVFWASVFLIWTVSTVAMGRILELVSWFLCYGPYKKMISLLWQNRQCYSQLPRDAKALFIKAEPSRTTGKGRGKCETRKPLKDVKVEASLPKEKASSISEIFKTFRMGFVRLNGILFTRTRYVLYLKKISAIWTHHNQVMTLYCYHL